MGLPPTAKNIMPPRFQARHFWGSRQGLCDGGASFAFRLPGGGASRGRADGDDLFRAHLAGFPAVSDVRPHPHDLPFRERADIDLTAILSAHADMQSARGGEWIFSANPLIPMD